MRAGWIFDLRSVKKRQRIVVICLMTYGDFVLLIPFLLELRRQHPAAQLTVMCGRRGYRLCRLYRFVDEVVNLQGLKLGRAFAGTMSQLRSLWGADVIYSLHPFFWGAVLAFLLGGQSRIGFAQVYPRLFRPESGFQPRPGARRWQQSLIEHLLLTDARVMQTDQGHAWTRFPQLLGRAASSIHPLRGCLVAQYPRTAKATPLIILAPFSGWTPKTWPLADWRRLASELCTSLPQAEVMVSIDPSSAAAAQAAFAPEPRVRLFAPGDDFDLLFRTFASASLVVAGDSFPLHVSSALNVPTVALLGPNPPEWFGGQSARRVDVYHRIECSPCVQGRGQERCLRGFETCAALQAISVAEVAEQCRALLAVSASEFA
jgi:ADP-heptose:LPS heptosyltransferase